MLRKFGWKFIDRFFSNPTDERLLRSRGEFVVEIGQGDHPLARQGLLTPGGYLLTVETALRAVEKVLSGPPGPGFWTPSRAFGADFILEIPGVSLEGGQS
jgi:short subunit dehydrogenase-like uncharacterized protein